SLQLRDAAPEGREGALGLLNRFQSFAGHLEKSLRPATPLGGRVTVRGCDEAVLFEAIEGGINRTEEDRSFTGLLDFSRNRNPVRLISDPQDREDDHQLEI